MRIVNKNGTNRDLINAILNETPDATRQAEKFAFHFKGKTHFETCKKLFDFCKSQIRYVEDPESLQHIKKPFAILSNPQAGTDCKSFSLFIAACLNALKIENFYKFASYDSSPQPSHVYVVSRGVILDPVYGVFNEEKKPTYTKILKSMKIAISGLYEESPQAIGKISLKNVWNKAKEAAKDVTGAAKVAGLALPRNAFLLLLSVNALNLATALSKAQVQNGAKISAFWKKFGGDPAKLTGAINKGKGKKPIAKGLGPKINGIGLTGAEEIAAAIATATPIILAASTLLKDLGVKMEQTNILPQGEVSESGFKDTINNVLTAAKTTFQSLTGKSATDEAANQLVTATPTDANVSGGDDTEKGGKISPLLMIGGGFLALKLLKII